MYFNYMSFIFNDMYCIQSLMKTNLSDFFEDHSCMFSFMYLYHTVCSRDLHLFSDNHQIKISHKSFLSLSLQ